jgi:hypothetical protein
VLLSLHELKGSSKKEYQVNTTVIRYQAVNIARIDAGNYAVNNTNGETIYFDLLRNAKNFVNANWGKDLIEAQFTATVRAQA